MGLLEFIMAIMAAITKHYTLWLSYNIPNNFINICSQFLEVYRKYIYTRTF